MILPYLYTFARRSVHGIRAHTFVLALIVLVIIYIVHYISSYTYAKVISLNEIRQNLVPAIADNSIGENQQLCDVMPKLNNGSWPVKNISITSLFLKNLAIKKNILPGGRWKPKTCTPQHRVAIVIPYRDRHHQLQIFLSHMHPFLQFQQLDYQIFIIEQSHERPFNRAKLFNVGFNEAERTSSFHCYIFQDVDLLPLNVNNIYGCTKLPRHLSANIDVFDFKIPYDWIFGGAVAILKTQFLDVNGFSNKFYGWGGEDDDFYKRVTRNGTKICRFEESISRYTMLPHKKEVPNEDRYFYLSTGDKRYESDGLNSLTYSVKRFQYEPLYSHVIVDL